MISPPPSTSERAPDENADLFDYVQLKRQVGFVVHSARRNRWLFLTVFVLLSALTSALSVMWPKTYRVQTKILAQRNQMMASLGNPRRTVPLESDAPTRAASETVLRRDNLVSLVKQTNLVDNWETSRVRLLRMKDGVVRFFRGRESDEDRLDGLVQLLERRLTVTTNEGTVVIAIDWPDGPMAYRLIEAAQQNFLEARHVTEVSSIEEAISILEAHADNVHDSIERTLEEIQKLQSGGSHVATEVASKPRAPNNFGLGEAAPEHELVQIKFLLRAKQRAISDLEQFRQKRLAELQAQLAEQKVVYSDQHPVIQDTQQRIAALREDSPQILALKGDEQELLAEYHRRGGRDPNSAVEPAPRPVPGSEVKPLPTPPRPLGENPQLAYSREQLRIATETYQDILLRIDAARIELDTARAAFKYRYSVVNPARLPKEADKPNVPLAVIGGLIAALMMAVLAALAHDLRRGRFLEGWQVEQHLGIPLLAEVKPP